MVFERLRQNGLGWKQRLGENPLVHTACHKDYALTENFKRLKFLAFVTLFLVIKKLWFIITNSEDSVLLIAATVLLFILSVVSGAFSFVFSSWFLKHRSFSRVLLVFFWLSMILVNTLSSFMEPFTADYQVLSMTLWLGAMGMLLIMTRKQILIFYSVFLLINWGIAFYAGSPFYYYQDITFRTVIVCFIAYFMQYPHVVSAVENLKHSSFDSLTNLMTRRAGLEKMALLLKNNAHANRHTALFMMDIDNFKAYNDTCGHQKGDEVLVLIADSIHKTFAHKEDVHVRYGGEEILVCATLDKPDRAEELAEKLHQQIGNSRMPGLPVTLSIGYVIIEPERSESCELEQLIRIADQALYEAKGQGKNCTVCFPQR